MGEDWLEIEIAVPAAAIELLGQALLELGSTGLIIQEQTLDTFEDPGELPLPTGDILVRAYFPGTEQPDNLISQVEACLARLKAYLPNLGPTSPKPTCCRLAGQNWARDWQQHFPPLAVGDQLIIQPSWSEQPVPIGKKILTLDPGQAFGTGTHATTSLCLEVIARLAASPHPPQRVLDVGTGSGILAMAAAALGSQTVLACDIDPAALRVARENVQLNKLARQVKVVDQAIEELDGRFDLVLANILAKENIRMADDFLQKMLPDSHLVLSGILNEQEEAVIEAYRKLPLALIRSDRREGWSCLTYHRHG